jgi:coenzyme F420-reducing hydrogenase alpha subunit
MKVANRAFRLKQLTQMQSHAIGGLDGHQQAFRRGGIGQSSAIYGRWPTLSRGHLNVGSAPDVVEKVAAWRCRAAGENLGLSGRPTSRS